MGRLPLDRPFRMDRIFIDPPSWPAPHTAPLGQWTGLGDPLDDPQPR